MKIDLNQQVTVAGIQKALSSFWSWWIGEICLLLPLSLQDRVRIWLVSSRIVLRDGTWKFLVGGVLRDISPAKKGGDAVAPSLLRSVGLIEVELPSETVLRRVVLLPRAAEGRMRSAVALQIERLSPFRAEEVAFDCVGQIGGEAPDQIAVDVAIVPKKTLHDLEDVLAKSGLSVDSFITDAGHRFRATKWHWRRDVRFVGGMTAAAGALLCIISFALAPPLRETEIENQSARVAELKSAAADAANAKIALDSLTVSAELLAQKNRAPKALDVLENLTLAVPSDVKLSQLEIDGHRVRMVGSTENIKLLIGTLKHSPWVASTHLNRPASSSGERFEMELTAR